MTRLAPLAVPAAALLAAGPALAQDCPADAAGRVAILSNDFPALAPVAGRAAGCATDALTVTANQTMQHADLQVPALTADPAGYRVKIGANGSLTALLTAGLVRPLDDLVAGFGGEMQGGPLVRIDGKVMAIALMANAEHFLFRENLLAEAGVEPSETWAEVAAAAEAIRAKGSRVNPIALAYAPGGELGQGFVNLCLGQEGELSAPGTAEPSIASGKGVAALEMMKQLAGFMNPDYLTYSSDALVPLLGAGEIARTNFWGAAASQVLPGTDVAPTAAEHMRLAPSAAMPGGTHPATTVRWDGIAIATNVSDEDAEASFRVMMHAIAPELAQESPELAVWLIKGDAPTAAAEGVPASVQGGTPASPTAPTMDLLHTATDESIVEFMQGEETAEQAPAEAEAAYRTAAQDAGFLQ